MLDTIADLLNLAVGSQGRLKFYDLASLQGGRIPYDILNDKESVEISSLYSRQYGEKNPADRKRKN